LFRGTGVVITDAGRHHVGSALGTDDFVKRYVQDNVTSWLGEMEKLSKRLLSPSVCSLHKCVFASSVVYCSDCTYVCGAFLST